MSTSTKRLMRPFGKVPQRLEREAIRSVASNHPELGFLDVEVVYLGVGSALVHLSANEDFRSRFETLAKHLVELTESALSIGGFSNKKAAELEACLTSLRAEIQKVFPVITVEKIEMFLAVVERNQEIHQKYGYDGSFAVDPKLHKFAKMVNENFGAYERTLNEM